MLLRRILCVILVCICYFAIVPLALDAPDSWEWAQFFDFMTRYNKSYRNNSAVVLQRFKVFQESLRRHEQLNAYEAQSGGTAVYGVNVFSDLTQEEFKRMYLSGLSRSIPSQACSSSVSHPTTSPPDKFDWRVKGVIGPVRNQQQCGSCWAFAIVETIASKYAIQYNHLYELSPQQLISCNYDPAVGLDGCNGGDIYVALSTLVEEKTIIVEESVYPFTSGDGKTTPCKQQLPHIGVQLKAFNCSRGYSEANMMDLLFTTSPLTVAVNAIPWQDYIGGIIQHHCSAGSLDHAVQIVGYDVTGPIPYWSVRNTWGTGWGEDGYVRIKYGNNTCGISSEVTAVRDVTGVGL